MWDYTAAWNEHDSTRVANEFWGMGATPEAMERQFEQLRAQGYDKSTIHEIKTCKTGPASAWAGMKFTRWKTDGEPLGERDRATGYDLEWVEERGWRIVSIGGRDAAEPLECPAGD